MRPTKPTLSPAALSLVLDALEGTAPATRKALSEATALGLSTVTRAASVCVSRGILRYEQSTDPVSGRPCRILTPTEGLLLPVLTLTRDYGWVRALDMAFIPVGTATVEFNPTSPPEDRARLLSRRCLTLLRGCGGAGDVTAPVLLVGQGLPAVILRETVNDTVGTSPLAVLSHGEAVARSMTAKPIPANAASLLFLSVGKNTHACLLLRDGDGRWYPSPLGEGLTHTLTKTLSASDASKEGLRRGAAVFLTDLCRFMRPDLIYIEDPRGALPDGSVFAPLLPDGVEVVVRPVENDLTVAEEGAGLIGRRLLWDKILQG